MSTGYRAWLDADWPAPPSIRALTTGGGGEGYGIFNLALHVGDDAGRVEANRRALRQGLGVDAIQWLQQVHSTQVCTVDRVQPRLPVADAMYSRVPGTALAVLTADCLPVVFCDRGGREIAVAHAGWRGLAAGILNRTLEQFQQPPGEVLAWIGPAIGQRCFEVGEDVRAAFRESRAFRDLPRINDAFQASGRPGHYFCDLVALARLSLGAVGVSQVYGGEHCTYSEPQRYYSYRREPQCGRMATVIVLQDR